MGMKSYFKAIADTRREQARAAGLEIELRRAQMTTAQLTKDILTLRAEERKYKGNDYQTYDAAVTEIDRKYRGEADWGVGQTGSIIDLRAAFIMAEGIKIFPVEADPKKAEAELAFARAFVSYNDLDAEVVHAYASEAEIEGKILIKLAWEADDSMVSARFIPWTEKRYTIETRPQDYLWYTKAVWRPKGSDKEETLEEREFVYKKFGGRIHEPNFATPRIMRCLTQIESLDKALRDWREINRIFAGPLLVFKYDDSKSAKQGQEDLDQANWKIRKIIHTTAEVGYKQPAAESRAGIETEIVTLAKLISGTTGAPVHFLGLPDLLSNRATAENLMELVFASTLKERTTWRGTMKEILEKAMAMSNEKTGAAQKTTRLDASKLDVEIPFISPATWATLEKVFVPLSIGGQISKELLLSKIPGVDVDEEMKRTEPSTKEITSEEERILRGEEK